MLFRFADKSPTTAGDDFFVAPSASVIGDVRLGAGASVWFGAVVRGDGNAITIGARTNIQDNAIVHVDSDAPATLGDDVTVGHAATVHGCTIGRGSLIGIGAIILSHAQIGEYCIVGAGALITERKQFPDRSLIIGVPARVAGTVSDEQLEMLRSSAAHYAGLGRRYRGELEPLPSP